MLLLQHILYCQAFSGGYYTKTPIRCLLINVDRSVYWKYNNVINKWYGFI